MTRISTSIQYKKRGRCQETTSEEKDEATEKMTKIWSLALPWIVIVIASIAAAAFVSNSIETDSDINWSERSLTEGSSEHHRVHKPVYDENHAPLFPLSMSDRVGFTMAICGLMLAAGGGIGGGGILVPIYILVMGFSPKHGAYDANA